MTWYHEDCVNDVDKGMWCFTSCRKSSRLVKSLGQEVSHMKGIIETIPNILQEMESYNIQTSLWQPKSSKYGDEVKNMKS